MNLGSLCQYAKTCPLYKGEEKTKDIPLLLFRNVFCNRGIKGWKNCDKYKEFTNQEKTE